MDWISTCVLTLVVCWLWKRWIGSKRRLPPGPAGWPVVGNFLELDLNDPRPQVSAWRQQFGNVFMFNLLGQRVVVVSAEDLVRAVLVTKQDDFAGRYKPFRVGVYSHRQYDVILGSDSPTWRITKKALHNSLKMYGEELLRLERITLNSIKQTAATIRAARGRPFNPQTCLEQLVFQILSILICTSECSPADAKAYIEAMALAERKHFTPTGRGVELEFMPWLRHFGHPVMKEIEENSDVTWNLYRKLIKARKAEMDEEHPECVLDALIQYQRREIQAEGKANHFTDELVGALLLNLFSAGMITTVSSTMALIAIMANHPEIQTRMQREIDEKIGDAEPRLKDRAKMHYVNAVIYEMLRYIQGTPYLLPHVAMRDSELGGYTIPKGTQIWCDVSFISHDPDLWEEPWTFNPERFLDDQGQLVGPDHEFRKRLFAFGGGRRACPGEVLAKNRLFLIISSLFQAFRFLPTQGKMAPNHDPRSFQFAFTLHVNPYEIIAKSRHDVPT